MANRTDTLNFPLPHPVFWGITVVPMPTHPFQAVFPVPFANNSAMTHYARTTVASLLAYGTEAVLFDTSTLPAHGPDRATARLLHQKLREIRPPGRIQIYVNLVPDLWFGNTSIPGQLARFSLDDPGLRVVNYIHEFTEGVRRYGEARTLALQLQQYPVGRLAVLAATTEFEARHLGHYWTFPNGSSLFPLLVPRLRRTHVIPMPPILPPCPEAQALLPGKFTAPGPLRLVVLGGFRPFKGTDPDSGLGLYHLLDALATRVRRGALPASLELHVAGRLSDTSRVENIPGGRNAPAVRCLESLFAPDDRARALLQAYLDAPDQPARARALESHLESHCARYPFPVRLHFDREDPWLSTHVLAPAHLGLLLSNRGVSLRNTVLTNLASHRIPMLANPGEECPLPLRPHLTAAYEESDREAALAGGRLEEFLAGAMEQAAEACATLLRNLEALASQADGAWEALGRPTGRDHARLLTAWFHDVLGDPPGWPARLDVRLVWPLLAPIANRACRDIIHDPSPRKNVVQALINAARRVGLFRTPLSKS